MGNVYESCSPHRQQNGLLSMKRRWENKKTEGQMNSAHRGRTVGQTDGWTDAQERMDGWTDGQTDGQSDEGMD